MLLIPTRTIVLAKAVPAHIPTASCIHAQETGRCATYTRDTRGSRSQGRYIIRCAPRIGTNKLPKLVAALRDSIREAGGEVHFDTRITDVMVSDSRIKGVVTANGDTITGEALILATGHSARDIFHLLHNRSILIEAKPFALGVRVEHAQTLIDSIQYHCTTDRGPYLPASSYALVHQARIQRRDRGVFSFCMCPGGFIVPAATAPGEVVVNGMSPSRRDSKFANSGHSGCRGRSRLQALCTTRPAGGSVFSGSYRSSGMYRGRRNTAGTSPATE